VNPEWSVLCCGCWEADHVLDCLSAALPLEIDSSRYVALVTTRRTEQTETDQQAAVVVMADWDRCVAAAVLTGR
jgi:hypothetical protein